MSALVPLVTSTGPLLDRASAGVRALVKAVSRREEDYFEEAQFNAAHVKKELQDASEEVKVRALKRLLAAHASGLDVSGLLPEVVKAIAVPSLELKRLVYLFLILHAERSRDVALLSINSFQKDLADRNQVIRATSLKALASIRLLEVVQLLMAALRRAAADSSPFVRRTAAQCVMKVFTLDPDQFEGLQQIVMTLLKDIEISVVGAALVAFRELCMRHGAAECLRLYGDQVSPQQDQQSQQDALLAEEQRERSGHLREAEEEEEEERLSPSQQRQQRQQASAYSKTSDKGAWRGRAREQEGSRRREEDEEERQEKRETTRHTDAHLQSNCNNDQRERGRSNRYREVHPAEATAAASENFSRCHAESTYHVQVSAAAAARIEKNFRAQACALGLLHQHYRRLQESMLQLEPFAQVVAVDVFLRYVRVFFAEPAAALNKQKEQRKQVEKQQLNPQRETQSARGSFTDSSIQRGEAGGKEDLTYETFIAESPGNSLSADLRMFLLNLRQLLYSESVAVVAAVAAAFYHLLPPAAWKPVVHPLLRCIYTSSVEVREPLLHITASFAAAAPSLFLPYFRNFFLAFNDPPCVKQGKLLVLRRLLFSSRLDTTAAAGEAAMLPPLLLQELCTYVRWPGDPLLLSACFNFLVNIAVRFPSAQASCIQIFVQLLDTAASCALASEAILALRVVLQQQQQQLQQQEQLQQQGQQQQQQDEEGNLFHDTAAASSAAAAVGGNNIVDWTSKKHNFRCSEAKKKIRKGQQLGRLVLQLAMHLSRVIQGAAARASIVWMVGEYQREVGWVAADVFRQLARTFAGEAEEVKLQILLLGLKVWALHWDNKQLLHEQQQEQQRRLSPEKKVTSGESATATAPSETTRNNEKNKKEEEAGNNGTAFLRNGVVVADAADVSDLQRQRPATPSAAGTDKVKPSGRRAPHEREQLRKQQNCPQEKSEDEQRYLLPPPTPEESAKAFPRLDKMLKYVCEAASFDMSYDVRDVARLYFALTRLALAGETLLHEKDGNSSNQISTSRRCHNSGSTPCSKTGHREDSTTASHSSGEDNNGSAEGSSTVTSVVALEKDVLEGLGGCGGEMFKTSSRGATADMSRFAQQYMRTLAMGSAGGRRRGLQSRLNTGNSGGRAASTSAVAAEHDKEEGRHEFVKGEDGGNLADCKRTRQSPRGYANPSCRGGGRNSTRSIINDEPASCCMWGEQNDTEGSASHSLLLGSLSELLGDRVHGYTELPPFAATDSPSELRKVEQPVAPAGLAQCLAHGRAGGGAGKERSGTLLSNHYVDIQEVKAISSDDIVIKKSAAALMGRDTNVKADFTSVDLDSFYADDLQSSDGRAGGLAIGNDDAIASSTAATSTGALAVLAAANAFAPLLHENNTLLSSSSVAGRRAFPGAQREENSQQQHSLWDMFGETHVRGGEQMTQQVQQQHNDDSNATQFKIRGAAGLVGAEEATAAGSADLLTSTYVKGREGGVAVAGEDEESDEEKNFFAVSH